MPTVVGTFVPPKLASAPGSPVSGQCYYNTGDNTLYWWNGTVWSCPGRELAYAQVTADVVVNTTTEATATTIVTAPAVTFDGSTVVCIEFGTSSFQIVAAVGSFMVAVLFDNGASIGFIATAMNPAASAMQVPVYAHRRLTPSAASHQFSIRVYSSNSGAKVTAGAGGIGVQPPAFIRVMRA